MSWHFSTDIFNWSQGNQGKGNVYSNGDVETWNVDEDGFPHHQQKAGEHGDGPVFLFYISPSGGVHDGGIGYSNTGDKSDDDFVSEVCERTGDLFPAAEEEDETAEAVSPRDEGGYGHAWSLVSSTDDMASELRSWLSTFTSAQSAPFDWADELQDDVFEVTMDAYGPDAPETVVEAALGRLGASPDEALDIREEWLRKALRTNESRYVTLPKLLPDDKTRTVWNKDEPTLISPRQLVQPFELMSVAVKSIEQSVNEERLSYEDATQTAGAAVAEYYYNSAAPEDRSPRMSQLIQNAIQSAWNYVMAGGLVPWSDSGDLPDISKMNFDYLPEKLTEQVPGWGEDPSSPARQRLDYLGRPDGHWSKASSLTVTAKAAAWDKPSSDLTEPERDYVEAPGRGDHRNPYTGEWCNCGYSSGPRQVRFSASDDPPASDLGTVGIYLDPSSSANRRQVEQVIEDAGYAPVILSRVHYPLAAGGVESLVAIYVPPDPELDRISPMLKHIETLAPVVLSCRPDELAGALDKASGKSPKDFVPNLQTDTGRRIFKQNQKAFRADESVGTVRREEGKSRIDGPLMLQGLDNLVAGYEVEGMLPWLAGLVKKGVVRFAERKDGLIVDDGDKHYERLDRHHFTRIANWFAAFESPHRQGVNISSLSYGEVQQKAEEHAEWVRDKEVIAEHQADLLRIENHYRSFDDDNDVPLDKKMVVDLPKPYEGWRVVQLTSSSDLDLESKILGHCIGSGDQPYVHAIDAEAIEAFSLRDPQGIPKATWHYNPSDRSLARVQGSSGYPNKYRPLITLFNEMTGRDDGEGGPGDEDDLSEWSGEDEDLDFSWDFGEINDIESLYQIETEPYDAASMMGAELGEDVEFSASADVDAIAQEAINDYNAWPDDLLRALHNSQIAGLTTYGLINKIMETLRSSYELSDQYAGDRIHPDAKPFTIESLQEDPDVDPSLVEYVKQQLHPADPSDLTPAQPQRTRRLHHERDDFWNPAAFSPEPTEPPLSPQQPVVQGWFGPSDVGRGVVVPLSETTSDPSIPVRDLDSLQRARRYREVMVPPFYDPTLIAHEYYKRLQSEGQQAANDWYYKQYPDMQPTHQQLVAHEAQ